MAVLDDLSAFNHQHAIEGARLTDVVRDAEQGDLPPQAPHALQQFAALLPVQPAEGLIQNGKPRLGAKQRASQPHPLAFAAYVGWSMVSSLFLTPLALCTMDSADWGTRAINPQTTEPRTAEAREVPIGNATR